MMDTLPCQRYNAGISSMTILTMNGNPPNGFKKQSIYGFFEPFRVK